MRLIAEKYGMLHVPLTEAITMDLYGNTMQRIMPITYGLLLYMCILQYNLRTIIMATYIIVSCCKLQYHVHVAEAIISYAS